MCSRECKVKFMGKSLRMCIRNTRIDCRMHRFFKILFYQQQHRNKIGKNDVGEMYTKMLTAMPCEKLKGATWFNAQRIPTPKVIETNTKWRQKNEFLFQRSLLHITFGWFSFIEFSIREDETKANKRKLMPSPNWALFRVYH